MSNPIRNLEIMRVENGFIVFNGLSRMNPVEADKWVARDVPDLLKIIDELLSDRKEGSDK